MHLQWKDSYKIGDAEIDAQHQHFFDLANNFLAAKDKIQLTHCAMAIYKHTRIHFNYEEKLMRQVCYPGLQDHLDWHNQMISHLNTISAAIAGDTMRTLDLVSVIEDWALNHIPVHDADLIQYLTDHSSSI
jgi:hemerythrin